MFLMDFAYIRPSKTNISSIKYLKIQNFHPSKYFTSSSFNSLLPCTLEVEQVKIFNVIHMHVHDVCTYLLIMHNRA